MAEHERVPGGCACGYSPRPSTPGREYRPRMFDLLIETHIESADADVAEDDRG